MLGAKTVVVVAAEEPCPAMTAPIAPPAAPLARRARAATIGARVISTIVPSAEAAGDRSSGPSGRPVAETGVRPERPPRPPPSGGWHSRRAAFAFKAR